MRDPLNSLLILLQLFQLLSTVGILRTQDKRPSNISKFIKVRKIIIKPFQVNDKTINLMKRRNSLRPAINLL